MKPDKRLKAHRQGLYAEIVAAWYLRFKGYRIVAKRYKCKLGEVDLIAYRKNTLVAVEVKYRKLKNQTIDHGLEAISTKSQHRIIRALQWYVQDNPEYTDHAFRFDAIIIAPPFRIYHLDNAWQSGT